MPLRRIREAQSCSVQESTTEDCCSNDSAAAAAAAALAAHCLLYRRTGMMTTEQLYGVTVENAVTRNNDDGKNLDADDILQCRNHFQYVFMSPFIS